MHTSYLGIDWGEKHVGLALASDEVPVAVTLETLHNTASLLDDVERVCAEHDCTVVVVGIPRYVHVSETKAQIETFVERLKQKLPQNKIVTLDETFSSKMGQESVKEKQRAGISSDDHQEAARIILQDWLDANAQ